MLINYKKKSNGPNFFSFHFFILLDLFYDCANFRVNRSISCRDLRGGGPNQPPPPPMDSSPRNNPMGIGLRKHVGSGCLCLFAPPHHNNIRHSCYSAIYIYLANYTQQKKKVNTYCTIIISYTNPINSQWHIKLKRNSSPIRISRNYACEIHAWLRSQIKNCKIAQTQWEYLFNDETFLMKGLALLLHVLWFFLMFTV